MPTSTARFELRPYQRAAISSVIAARRRGVRRQVLCLPTGAGKTVIFSELTRMARRDVLVLAHRSELVQQARDKLARALQDDDAVGIEQAGQTADPSVKVVAASLRSLSNERIARLRSEHDFGLVIYDECHHAPAEDNQRVLRELGCFEESWTGTLAGFTATTGRGDRRGLDEVFEELVFQLSLGELIEDGFLVPLRGFRVSTAADLHGVSAGSGDFDVEELAEAVDIEERNALVARSIVELARGRRTIAFCVTVNHATHLARALNGLGLPAGIVHGKLKADARAKVLRDFREGRIQALSNVGVLTEGFDDPGVSCIAMARPTRSEGLYAQCVGRGTRLAEGKSDCIVLDFVDLSDLSLQTLPGIAGLPPEIDLEGAEVHEAQRMVQQLLFDHPGFELEADTISLEEIKRRAASFDPLSMAVNPEVLAVSPHAWESLGVRGLALHFFRNTARLRRAELSEVLIVDGGGRKRSKRWRVSLEGKERARFSRIEEAVEAVDYEVHKMGRLAASSSMPNASWRSAPVPPELARELLALPRYHQVQTWGEALTLLTLTRHGRAGADRARLRY